MTRTFIARLLLALAVFSYIAFWSETFMSASSDNIVVAAGGPQSASPTPTPVYNGLPVVSPNGVSIVFSSNSGGEDDLFIIFTDGSKERQLTHTPEVEGNLAWTTNGKQVLFLFSKTARAVSSRSTQTERTNASWPTCLVVHRRLRISTR